MVLEHSKYSIWMTSWFDLVIFQTFGQSNVKVNSSWKLEKKRLIPIVRSNHIILGNIPNIYPSRLLLEPQFSEDHMKFGDISTHIYPILNPWYHHLCWISTFLVALWQSNQEMENPHGKLSITGVLSIATFDDRMVNLLHITSPWHSDYGCLIPVYSYSLAITIYPVFFL